MRQYDPLTGPRRDIYRHFRSFQYPWTTLCGPIDVDARRLKEAGGLFGNLLWAALRGANAVPELRQRIRVIDGADVVVEHDQISTTCTVARDDGTFAFTPFPWTPDRAAFLAALPTHIAAGAAQPGLLPDRAPRDDLTFISCVPWLEMTSVQHAMRGDPLDCVPRIVWGRVPASGRLQVCLTAHHALVDGRHIASFFAEMQRAARI